MNSRQRFRETMRYGRPDRVPCFEEGLRDGVLERWHTEGLPEGADVADVFDYDRRERVPVNFDYRPAVKTWPTSRRGLRALRRRLDPDDPARLPDEWPARVAAWRGRDHVLELQVHNGFFLSLGVDTWARFGQVVYQLHDARPLLREIMEMRGEFAARLADRVLEEVEVDFASFSEPIGGNAGPLLSPALYEEFVLPTYRPALDVLRRRGVETIVFITYANARALLPAVLRAGFNCLWACEVNVEAMDYRNVRAEFGRDLRLIGGIDLDTVLEGEEAIRREMEENVAPLLADGGYVPLADGRVRPNVPFPRYACYRRLLENAARVRPRQQTSSQR